MSGDDYKVGKGKPPLQSRFKPGQSGNPKGRPIGRRNSATIVLAAMNEKIVVTEGGRTRRITKLEAAAKQLANKAATGERHSLKLALELTEQAEVRAEAQAAGTSTTAERRAADLEILQTLQQRMHGGGRDDG